MPNSQPVPSKAGQIVEIVPISDERGEAILGEVDSVTVESGPDLVVYVAGELANALSRIGFDVRQVDQSAWSVDRKRVRGTLLSAEVSCESTLMYPVAAAVRMRIELIQGSDEPSFRKEIRGAVSRDLGFHKQGGPEDAELLAEAVQQAVSNLEVDQSFLAALQGSVTESPTAAASDPVPLQQRVKDRLSTLGRLLAEGLISKEDYDRKRREILDEL